MTGPPAVSVCVPAYDAERYVAAAIDSVRRQTFPSWELIVVDDCSNDATRAVIEGLLAREPDPRITLRTNPSRLGMAGNWNRALELARGEFVKVLCDDDLLAPGCLAAQVETMRRHPGVSLVTSSRTIISARGAPLFVRRSFGREGVHPGRKVVERCLGAGTNLIGEPSAVLLRRSVLAQAGGFRESVVYYTDLDLWLRVLLHGDLYFIREPLVSFRIHARSATRSAEGQMLADYFRMAEALGAETGTRLTPLARRWISLKVRALNATRRAIYNRLAQR